MNIIEPILIEFTHEAANTRKMLERAPQKDWAWKPHEKSMTLGHLVNHIVDINHWVRGTLDQEEIVFDMENYKPPYSATVAELLAEFDKTVADACEAMKGRKNEHMAMPWRLKIGSRLVFELPRVTVIRTMVLNHIIHHRGQLSVYLRMKGVPLPAIYGPSADENVM